MIEIFSIKSTELYMNKEKQNSKHIFSHALQIIKINNLEEKLNLIEDNDLKSNFESNKNNIEEFIILGEAEKIYKLVSGFNRDELIDKKDMSNEEIN